jgi:hypothetical protein
MSTAQQIAGMVLHADSVRACKIKAAGGRGGEYGVKEWPPCNFSESRRGSFRVIYGSSFELWHDEPDNANIDVNTFKVNGVEVVVPPDTQ